MYVYIYIYILTYTHRCVCIYIYICIQYTSHTSHIGVMETVRGNPLSNTTCLA